MVNETEIPVPVVDGEYRGGPASAHPMVEALKRRFVKHCQGFVVPGKASREYLRGFGVQERLIFQAPNAVDNRFFMEHAARARSTGSATRAAIHVPERYFLYVGRLVPAKGLFELLDAYAKLDLALRSEVGLVIVGDGAARAALMESARRISPGVIHFPGFVHKDGLAASMRWGRR